MRLALVLFAVPALIASGADLPDPEAYSFHTLSAGDTIAVERVTRTADRVDVDMLLLEDGVRFVYTLELGPDATVRQVTNRFFRQQDDEDPTQVVTATFRGDSVDVEISGNRNQSITVETIPGALPWIRPSSTLIEQALMRSRHLAGATPGPVQVPFFNVANGQSIEATVEWDGTERAVVRFAEATISAELEAGVLTALTTPGVRGRVVRSSDEGG
ncbi:MAG TPA: hypothetical protein VK966_06615 [Longimicrobiales bacterium]|nr:hypothetical protein [Longimicrobiales bacterium]